MRYFNQPDVLFKRNLIKEELPPPDKAASTVAVKDYNKQLLDELAAAYYGDGMEAECYKIFNENITELTEADFDLDKIFTMRIPI
jgi:hypothetical protein